jgi:Astacin (Peptidase family M12A)
METSSVRSTALLAGAAVVAAGLASPPGNASVSFTDVWYPNGNIHYYIQDDAEDRNYDGTIKDVMDYMIDHTPLDIDQVFDEDDANLHFAVYWGLTDLAADGGMTNGYWDENHADDNKKIRFDPDNAPGRSTVTHEFGHALGRPHEFQREDRDDYVDVCFNLDPYNYSEVGSSYFPDPAVNLSPYDYGSIMNSGYGSCVTAEDSDDTTGSRTYAYSGGSLTNLLSRHDINGI